MKPRGLLAVIALLACIVVPNTSLAFKTTTICPGVCTASPTTTPKNGIINMPEIVLIFWDTISGTWTGGFQTPTQSELIGQLLAIENSPYFASLRQYQGSGGVIGLPRISPMMPYYQGTPSGSASGVDACNFQMQDVNNLVQQLINNGSVPSPSGDLDVIYTALVPNGCAPKPGGQTPTGCNNANGCNMVKVFSLNNIPYTIAVVGGTGNTNNLSANSAVFSHEMAEAISTYSGLQVGNCTQSGNPAQISDICNCYSEVQYNVAVQPYWSQADGACVVPETWGTIVRSYGQGYSWASLTGLVKQAYGGGGGFVFTDTNYNVFYNNGSSSTQIGGPAPQFAAGFYTVGALPFDVSNGIGSYNRSTQAWTDIGTPNNKYVTSLTVTNNGWIVTTDRTGYGWIFYNGSWYGLGGAGGHISDQFIASGPDILSLDPTHQIVSKLPGSDIPNYGCCWQVISGPTFGVDFSQIIASSDTSDWGTANIAGYPGPALWFYPFAGAQSGEQFINAFQYAVSNAYNVSIVAYNGAVWAQTSNPTSAWYGMQFANVGRLVSGNEVYATDCSSGTVGCVYY